MQGMYNDTVRFYFINDAVFEVNPTAPIPFVIGFQRLRLPQAIKRRFATIFQEGMYFFKGFQIILHPPSQILPGFGHKNEFKHVSSL
jgi:hypothetical protein